MKRASVASRGVARGLPLATCGRAERWECSLAPGDARGTTELWRLPASDEAVGDRLLTLGEANIGGFVDGGIDETGVWLLRRLPGVALAEQLRETKGTRPWREAVALAAGIARALAMCEQASLFPGPLTPDSVVVADAETKAAPAGTQRSPGAAATPDTNASQGSRATPTNAPADGALRATLVADALVSALVGEGAGGARGASGTVSPRWTPPEQADGAIWDSAANRYALGLILYRLIAGAHPFGGAGLRHAFGEAAHREAAPFVDAIAAALPTGLQSLTLRLLDPDRTRRPARAATIAEDLEGFLSEAAPKARAAARNDGGSARRGEGRASVLGGSPGSPATHAGDAAHAPRDAALPRDGALPRDATPARSGFARRSGAARPPTAITLLKTYWPLAAGLLVALGALSLLSPAPPPKKPATPVGTDKPLDATQTAAADCATCHARQASEWRRSVMAHSVKSPLFNALESLIEEQVGRDADCPNGAGILRRVNGATACRDRTSGQPVTGSGGEHWCVNCHSPGENLSASMPAWEGRAGGDPRTRLPVRDLLNERSFEGISCGFCHQVHGPVGPRAARGYQGNPTWTSFVTGAVFAARPEDARGLTGIGNSGYELRPEDFLLGRADTLPALVGDGLDPRVHRSTPASTKAYLRSSEFCGSCHDVRLFGTDSFGAAKGEHFKRLRNAYSEWASWAKTEERAGRKAASCQDCHMSTYPGICEPVAGEPTTGEARDPECPPGMRFVARAPGEWPKGRSAENSPTAEDVVTHYFSGVDVPLSREFPEELVDEPAVDLHGIPLSARRRRDILLRHTFRFAIGGARRGGAGIEIPIEVENIGAGHRVPAGFSQEREFWVHLTVRDGDGRVVYEVGRVDRVDEDLRDKVFERVGTQPDVLDAQGRPEGLFGADVRDGPDVQRWDPPPDLGGTSFRGRGLVNFQNGFLRCVRCIGTIDAQGDCQPLPGQERRRADRFADGAYDLDTGECRSNLSGNKAFFETFFPVGALDASRGLVKGPDAIIDSRSLPPQVPIRYTYDLATQGRRGPFKVEARLMFRAFPPFLIKGFAAYEREQARRGLRPSGPLVTDDMIRRLEIVELSRQSAEIR